MRLEDADWVGPTQRVLESRRSTLPKLERVVEKELPYLGEKVRAIIEEAGE